MRRIQVAGQVVLSRCLEYLLIFPRHDRIVSDNKVLADLL